MIATLVLAGGSPWNCLSCVDKSQTRDIDRSWEELSNPPHREGFRKGLMLDSETEDRLVLLERFLFWKISCH
jgi:hypothetical protein